MQKRSDNNADDSEDITSLRATRSQNIQYQYPPGLPTFDQQFTGQYPPVQNGQNTNFSTGIINPGHPAGAHVHVYSSYPENPTAQQHYALQHQHPMQQPPPQQMYYPPQFPQQQQQQNHSLSDVNAAIQLTSALINQITANNNASYVPQIMVQPNTAAQNQNTANLINNQAPPRRTINFDGIHGPYSHLVQAGNNGTVRSREVISLLDCNEDTSQMEEETVAAASEQKVKRRTSNNPKRQKQPKIESSVHNQAVPVFKRKEPPEMLDAELKLPSKPTKKRRQSNGKQQKQQKTVQLPMNINNNMMQQPMIQNQSSMQMPLINNMMQQPETRNHPSMQTHMNNKMMRQPIVHPQKMGQSMDQQTMQLGQRQGMGGTCGIQPTSSAEQYIHPNDPVFYDQGFGSKSEPEHDALPTKGQPSKPAAETRSKPDCVDLDSTTDKSLNVSVVVPEDEHLVTPYITTLMRQYKRCTLTNRTSYNTGTRLGFPGLECIHCTGPDSQQFFYNNTKSMSGNLGRFGDHLLTCSGAPDALKKSIEELKEEHKTLPCQSRKSFFDGILNRLLRDYNKDDVGGDSKNKLLQKDGNKNGVCGGNKNGKRQAKPARTSAAQKASVDKKDKPLAPAKDEHMVNAFVFFVVNQYKRCTVDAKQRSHYDVGFPGLECIHCTGHRRFFSRDAQSTRKNCSQLSNHLSECSGASDTVKETLSKLQDARHKKSPNAESFFNNIWIRLQGDSCFNEQNANVKKQVKPAQKATADPSKTSVVIAEDRQLINEFTFALLSQYRRCKLDLLTKGVKSSQTRFDHGHPGLECIHCAGPKSRKFFYGGSHLLQKNFAHLYKHFSECKSAPATLKESLAKLKNENHRSNQQDRVSFFNAVWARLQHECDAESDKKKSSIKPKTNKKTGEQQNLKRANGKPCNVCRSRKVRCDDKQWYCLYNVGSTVTDKDADRHEAVSKRQPKEKKPRKVRLSETPAAEDSFLCKVISQDSTQIDYPHAPMGQLWLDKSFAGNRSHSDLSDEASIDIHAGGTLIGRRYVWDEGYFVDQHHDVDNKPSRKIGPILRGCTCGADHSYTMGASMESNSKGMKGRRSERSGGSMRTSTVLSKLADGTLSPHTLIYPDEYTMGPELRFQKNLQAEKNVQPFSIRVSPDALFLGDLHAHLSDSEIIGFLGGHYSPSEKCIYIQAAFPCKATDRVDAGDTDVEMDPVSQIYAREAISNHGLSVVGWYHSHPTFQPNPSVTDIENQASYQQLFQGDNEADNNEEDDDDASTSTTASPFVGLIIGTYDGQNPTSESVMRWFHVISKKTDGKDVNYPMQLKTTHRHFRVLDDELRPAMTSQGAIIRQGLESKYLSCPITKRSQPSQIEVSGLGGNTHSAILSDKVAEQQTQKKQSDNGQHVRVQSSSSSAKNDKDHNVSIMGSDRPALLLSESLFEQPWHGNETIRWKFKSAIPLYFTTTEREILQMDTDIIPNDVLAGIIWFAVEREQTNPATQAGSLLPASVSPSSRAILELLLRLSFTGSDDMQRKLYEIIHSLEGSESEIDNSSDEMRFNDIDAVITHKVDAVLSHYYSSKQKKINPFKSWSGAGDKGKNIDTEIDEAGNSSSTSNPDAQFSWAHYYMTEVLHMSYDVVGNRKVYRGGSKMKRGQKIAACLLKWARHMQLRPDFESIMRHNSCNEGDLQFDSETSIQQFEPIKNGYIFVVAEVMRLLAARWSEAAEKTKVAKKKEHKRIYI
ncbi:histone H2A deubiquitinase [Skeletonema marinoi]|uniref:Histone H2A deubiquitinase n=1 Tax=Skeletonema marinoi TaxID=267567 RepID=A0AAD9DGN3_9STRA|nr:histone H2A deubiquitinase [Skeletonema marinoi]